MAEQPIDIEKIVRQVLAEMHAPPKPAPEATSAPAPSASPSPARSQVQQAAQEGDLVVTSRVVTMAELGDRLAKARRLVVGPRAVVTPAVRDELLRHNVPLVYRKSEAVSGERPSGVSVAVVATGTRFDATGVLKLLDAEGIQAHFQAMDCLIASVDALAGRLNREETLGLLLTQHTAAAVCLANRLHGVRAIWGADVAVILRDAAAVGANLLVIDPVAVGPYTLRQMVLQFCRHGPRPCPDVLRQRLE